MKGDEPVKDKRTAARGIHLASTSIQLEVKDEVEDTFNWERFLYQDPSLQKFKDNEALGYGVERCLYELNPDLACLSPCLIHAAALTPAQALIALEDVAAQPNRPSFPIDKHLAAFLMSRWKEMKFMDMRDMGKPQREIKNLAVLRILAGMQSQFKIQALPNLCQWMAHLCSPIISHYHNLKARAQIEDEIIKAVSSGQLMKLARVFENRQALLEDKSDYQAAKIEVLLIESEIKEIELKIRNRNQLAPHLRKGILGRISFLFYKIWTVVSSQKSKMRIAQLYHQSENLQETWGVGLLPRTEYRSRNFWGKIWAEMKISERFKTHSKKSVDARLKYD